MAASISLSSTIQTAVYNLYSIACRVFNPYCDSELRLTLWCSLQKFKLAIVRNAMMYLIAGFCDALYNNRSTYLNSVQAVLLHIPPNLFLNDGHRGHSHG
jgi:hypothetical protein